MSHTPNIEPKIKKSLFSNNFSAISRKEIYETFGNMWLLRCTYFQRVSKKVIDMNIRAFQNVSLVGLSLSLLNDVDCTKTLALTGY